MSSEPSNTHERILTATWHLMEERTGNGVHMADIAKRAGISRQALYLHFESRVDLLVETVIYVDVQNGLDDRMMRVEEAESAVAKLEALVDVWGNYIPEIYGLARALLNADPADEASRTAYNDRMACLWQACEDLMMVLAAEDQLADGWTVQSAAELMRVLLAIQTWEQLTVDQGWTTAQYVEHVTTLMLRTFVKDTQEV